MLETYPGDRANYPTIANRSAAVIDGELRSTSLPIRRLRSLPLLRLYNDGNVLHEDRQTTRA
jgi:hypothetical protein